MYQKNYYEDLKDLNEINREEDCSSFQLLTASGEFLWNKMAVATLILAIFMTVLPLIPFIVHGNLAAHYVPENLETYLRVKATSASMWTDLANLVIQTYFIFLFFLKAKDFDAWASKSKLFLKGLGKIFEVSILAFIMLTIYMIIAYFLLSAIGTIGTLILAFGLAAILFFIQVFFISIMDDTRVTMGDAWDRLTETLKNKNFWKKILFVVFLNTILSLTYENLMKIIPDPAKVYAGLGLDFLLNILSLIIIAFTISSFIYYSDHVRYYLLDTYARDYGLDDDEIIEEADSEQ
ncbi:hypothetical protein [uncultured Ezakiella sp.]|uniref:hypothetical protein n=1 Tax=uncultured Ezakiella sp. TaxID=1637529 RepID=UPI0025FF7D3B|nr:hypothetical protein [uncultured Ezakiella sp.]